MTYEEAIAAQPVGHTYWCHTVVNTLAARPMEHIALGVPSNDESKPVYRGDVVDALKIKIAELEGQIEGHKTALKMREQELTEERSRKFPEPGWFLPREKLSESAAGSLDHLIAKAKQVSVVNVVVSPGEPYEIQYEADWVKYLKTITGNVELVSDMTWVVKLGSAIAKLDEPILINRLRIADLDEKYQRLMQRCGHPQSHSVLEAMKQLVNEITYGSISLLEVVQKVANGDASKELANQGGCVDPKNCCTRNRPLNEQSTCTRVVNASKDQIKVHTDLGVPDASSVSKPEEFTCAECPHQAVLEGCCGRDTKEYPQQPMDDKTLARHIEAACDVMREELGLPKKPVYSVAALSDPTTLQKAMIMGLVGTEKQQEEAREFLTQHIQLVKDYPATMSMAMQRQ